MAHFYLIRTPQAPHLTPYIMAEVVSDQDDVGFQPDDVAQGFAGNWAGVDVWTHDQVAAQAPAALDAWRAQDDAVHQEDGRLGFDWERANADPKDAWFED